jgi:nucleotide-binding universal stress UspA family protein
MTQTILVGAHAEHPEADAIGLAVALGLPFSARLVLGGVHIPSGEAGDTEAREQLAAELARVRARIPSDVSATTELVDAVSVARGLLDLALAHDADLLVIGHHHRGGLLGVLRGDLAADVAFSAPCGVVVAQPGSAGGALQRVGVAWDQTPAANEALDWAVRLVERTNGELRIMRALEPSHPEGTHPGRHEQVRLTAAAEAAALRVPAKAQALWGDPAPELIKASRELDLLVMGSRAHGALRRALFGSVSTRVLHDAQCAVAVLPAGRATQPPAG